MYGFQGSAESDKKSDVVEDQASDNGLYTLSGWNAGAWLGVIKSLEALNIKKLWWEMADC